MKNKFRARYKEGVELLTRVYEMLQRPATRSAAMLSLFQGLLKLRAELPNDDWRFFCERICLSHPVRELLHQDPVSSRSFSKPRGYAGDAVLLDLIYGENSERDKNGCVTEVGRAVERFNTSRPAASAVRWRRAHLRRLIDETADTCVSPEILSVACGHLREARDSTALQRSRINRLVALDQDELSLQRVSAEQNGCNVTCVQADIRALIRGQLDIGRFDFIYSAGLYDYLNDTAARLLTKSLFKLLKKNGRLLIANFSPENPDSGYMEAFMGWKLIYRLREEFERIVPERLQRHVQKIYFDDNWTVVYLELRKRN